MLLLQLPTLKPWLAVVVQVLLGLALAFALYMISLRIMQSDKIGMTLLTDSNPAVETMILSGYTDSVNMGRRMFNASLQAADNYVHLPRSFNRKGGAQFTYQLWVLVGDPATARDKTIFLRGDVRRYVVDMYVGEEDVRTVKQAALAPEGAQPLPPALSPGVRRTPMQVACPAFGFGPSYDNLVVSFNTVETPFNSVQVNSVQSTDSTLRRDALKLMAHKWALLTVQMEDNVPVNDFENGIVLRFYLNDMLYFTQSMQGTLKMNSGDLYLFPDGGIELTRIGDLRYYNYAIGQARVRAVYERGPPKQQSDLVLGDAKSAPLFLSEYNKHDIYNA